MADTQWAWCPEQSVWHEGKDAEGCPSASKHVRQGDWEYEDAVWAHPITREHRLPVVNSEWAHWKYHVALLLPSGDAESDIFDNKAIEPTEGEVAMLASYLEFWLARTYNERWLRKMRERPIDIDSGTVTRTFLKRRDDDPAYPERLAVPAGTETWHYRVSTWEHSFWPFSYTMSDKKNVPQFTSLERLLDHIESFGGGKPSQRWIDWKASHPDIFTRVTEGV